MDQRGGPRRHLNPGRYRQTRAGKGKWHTHTWKQHGTARCCVCCGSTPRTSCSTSCSTRPMFGAVCDTCECRFGHDVAVLKIGWFASNQLLFSQSWFENYVLLSYYSYSIINWSPDCPTFIKSSFNYIMIIASSNNKNSKINKIKNKLDEIWILLQPRGMLYNFQIGKIV